MNIYCIIPVRGGSKGIPGKNKRPIAGKPLVSWSIQQALAVLPSSHVIVSTDSTELAEIAALDGATVPFLRPAHLAEDESPTEPTILHAIEFLESRGEKPDAIMLLQATSPVRLKSTLQRAMVQFQNSQVDSMVGVVKQAPFLWRDPANPKAEYQVDKRPRRQELEESDFYYLETGSLYISKVEVYKQFGNRLGGKIGLFVMDEVESHDIDTELDFEIAEYFLGDSV
jgi:N-acylneuraminate cytidylyltransferase